MPGEANQVWSADFMSDALSEGIRFRTFNSLLTLGPYVSHFR